MTARHSLCDRCSIACTCAHRIYRVNFMHVYVCASINLMSSIVRQSYLIAYTNLHTHPDTLYMFTAVPALYEMLRAMSRSRSSHDRGLSAGLGAGERRYQLHELHQMHHRRRRALAVERLIPAAKRARHHQPFAQAAGKRPPYRDVLPSQSHARA